MAAVILLSVWSQRSTAAATVQVLPPVTDSDGRIGLCDVLSGSPTGPSSQPWAQLAYNAGARLNRWEFRWDHLEPQRGTWNFTATDAAVQSAKSYGIDTLGILIGTPGWAVAPGQRPGNGVPRGLYLGYNDSRNLWATYVRQTVQHYQGQVGYWEIWNEPDLSFFWMSTPEDYFRLLKVAYLTIKSVDPVATVLLAGMVVPDFKFVSQVLADARKDTSWQKYTAYFDVAAWHGYGPASAVYGNITSFRSLLASQGIGSAPLWVTEDGFPASNPNGEPRQAAYVIQSSAYALAAGAARVLVYRASDDAEPKSWGVISSSGIPRMAYVAFQVAASYFAHYQSIVYAPTDSLARFAFYEPTRVVTVLWNRGTTDLRAVLQSGQPNATLIDWMGQATPLTTVAGQLRITTPGANYNVGVDPAGQVVGGPPQLVVQDNVAPAGLTASTYVPPISGTHRRLIILNPLDTPVDAQVAASERHRNRVVLHMTPNSLLSVDLDLLAGSSYQGMFAVKSTAPVSAEAVSDAADSQSIAPASSWLAASAPAGLTVGNASKKQITATIAVYGAQGRERWRQKLLIAAARRVDWTLPAPLIGRQMALEITASGPIVLGSLSTDAISAESRPETTQYLVHPEATQYSLFNPDPAGHALIDIHFLGTSNFKSEQVDLRPHGSIVLPAHGAEAVTLSASLPVALGYPHGASPFNPVASQPSTRTVLPTAGQATGISLFNPSQRTAHVAMSILGRAASRQVTADLAPMQIQAVHVRSTSGPPKGVLVSSDLPVVAVASP